MRIVKGVFFAALLLGAVSCGNDEKEVVAPRRPKESPRELYLKQISRYEAEMHKSLKLDPNVATIAAKAYDDFVTNFPDDSLSPDFVFKAAEISTANQQYTQALMYYEMITSKYPGFKLTAESLYLQGYLLDNFLNDDEKAKVIYEQVIAKYPDLPYASDAKAAIRNLGKSDEELIREFERKNKKRK
jgi:outer membrane protein assembly factor BamD (BamD/ComL family)